jgi:hypothetical protein
LCAATEACISLEVGLLLAIKAARSYGLSVFSLLGFSFRVLAFEDGGLFIFLFACLFYHQSLYTS